MKTSSRIPLVQVPGNIAARGEGPHHFDEFNRLFRAITTSKAEIGKADAS